MHNAAFAALGIDARFLAFDVPPAQLSSALAGCKALRVCQLAVSIPHKETVIPYLDKVDAIATEIGAVNTITLDRNLLIGSNTDWIGLVRALERVTSLKGKHAVVLGAGGTARAATFGLLRSGARVTILNRTVDRAKILLAEIGGQEAGSLDELAEIECDILVNTTSVGMSEDASPIRSQSIPEGSIVFDSIYSPETTRLLQDASEKGCTTIGGKWMLVAQALEQIKLWTGLDAPEEIVANAFDLAGEV
jgi:shikimate dehydrogenase